MGRVFAALDWALKGTAGTALVGFGYFGIDWVGRAATGFDVPPTFWLTVVTFALFGGFFGFVARMLRYRHWVIDRAGRTLALSNRRAFADPQVEELSFDQIRRVVLRERRTGQASVIVAEFSDGTSEVLASTRLGRFGFDGVELGLTRAFDDTGVPVDVETQE